MKNQFTQAIFTTNHTPLDMSGGGRASRSPLDTSGGGRRSPLDTSGGGR